MYRLFEEIRVQSLPQSQRSNVFSIFSVFFEQHVNGMSLNGYSD